MKKFLIKGLILIIILALPLQGVSMSYFSDTETASGNTFTVGVWDEELGDSASVVINEVYYDVASDKGNEGDTSNPNEWVELYNNSDNQVNLKDWTLSDNSGSKTINHANKYIPGKGYAVIAKSANTWTYWSIPTGATKIVLGQKIGDGLDDDGDRVVLKESNGTEIDAVSWGSDTYAFTPSVADMAEGHSISRVTKGVDTDVASDWMDTYPGSVPPGPNPGTNPHPSETVSEPESETDEGTETADAAVNEELVEQEQEQEEGTDEEVSGPQDPADPSEVEEEDEGVPNEGEEDDQAQPDENEQEAVIEETEDEAQGASGDEPVSESELETIELQPEDPGQTGENNETFTE